MKINRDVNPARRQIQMQVAHAGYAAHLRIDRGLHHPGTDRRIHHVGTGTQDVDAASMTSGCAAETMP
jgi:hypothetical protein